MRYRVNYGNGQVWEVPGGRKACEAEAKANPGAWVQFYEPGTADCPGEWFRARPSKAR